jgi:hypothetical protein
MFDYGTKEKEHQNTRQSDLYSGAMSPLTNQIASCFDALSITCTTFVKVSKSGVINYVEETLSIFTFIIFLNV